MWARRCSCLVSAALAGAQTAAPPTLRAAHAYPRRLRIDGVIDESEWASAEAADEFRADRSVEGAAPSGRTSVRVLAGAKALVIGIVCDDPEPSGIVSFSVRRDAALNSEDHVRVVFGPFRRRPVRIRVLGQSQRRSLRRPDQPGRRIGERRLGRHLGSGDAADGERAGAPRSGFRSDPELQSRPARMALQRRSVGFSDDSRRCAGRFRRASIR